MAIPDISDNFKKLVNSSKNFEGLYDILWKSVEGNKMEAKYTF